MLETTACHFEEIIENSSERFTKHEKNIYVNDIDILISTQENTIDIIINDIENNKTVFVHREVIFKNTKEIISMLPKHVTKNDTDSDFYRVSTYTEIPKVVKIITRSKDFVEAYPSYGCCPFKKFKSANDKKGLYHSFCNYGGNHEFHSFECHLSHYQNTEKYIITFQSLENENDPWCNDRYVYLHIDCKNKNKLVNMFEQYEECLNQIYNDTIQCN